MSSELVFAAVIVLQGFATLSSIDGLYLHLWRLRLHQRPDSYREHLWHTARAILFAPTVVLLFVYPHQAGTVLLKVNLLALAAWAGYWIDRSAFPYARPGDLLGPERSAAAMRRAVIIAGAMLSMALAL